MTQQYDINCPKCGGTGFIKKTVGYFSMVLACDCNKELAGAETMSGLPEDHMIRTDSGLFKKMFGGNKKQPDDQLDGLGLTIFSVDDMDKLLKELDGYEPEVGTSEPTDGEVQEPLTDEDFEAEIPWRDFGSLMGVDPHCIGSDFEKCPVKDLEPERVHRQRVAQERCRELLKAFEAIVEDPNLTTQEHTFELISDFSQFMGDLHQ